MFKQKPAMPASQECNAKVSAGFTLIELLIVIAIIGILSAIVLVALDESRENARNAQVISQMKEYQKSLELFYSSNGYYPGTTADRQAKFCFGDEPVGNCMGSITSAAASEDFPISVALRAHMSALPRIEQPSGGLNYSSPAYSGCSGVGMANTSCTERDYSFWFLLEGTNEDCEGAIVANPSLSGEYTLCRISSK